MQPKVSVIIPVYNVEKFLAACLESTITQTLIDIEIICVEDGSTDNSKSILKEIGMKDSRIKIIWHEQNSGLVKTRKDGVLAAQGKYIMFLDSDDELFPSACETAYNAIEESKTDVIRFGTKLVDSDGKERKEEFFEIEHEKYLKDVNLLYLMQKGKLKNWSIWNKIYLADLCKRAYQEMKDTNITNTEDIYFFFVFGYYAHSIAAITDLLYLHRWGSGMTTRLNFSNNINFDYYKKLLESKDSFDMIVQFINSKPDKEEYKDLVQRFHYFILYSLFDLWQVKLAEEHKKEGLIEFFRKWGTEETATAFIWAINELNRKWQWEQTRMEEELQRTKDELQRTKNEVTAIKSGWSFRLGRIITSIPRKIRGLIQRG